MKRSSNGSQSATRPFLELERSPSEDQEARATEALQKMAMSIEKAALHSSFKS